MHASSASPFELAKNPARKSKKEGKGCVGGNICILIKRKGNIAFFSLSLRLVLEVTAGNDNRKQRAVSERIRNGVVEH